MNATKGAVQPTNDPVSLQLLAQWLKAHGNVGFGHTDPRSLMAGRYPHGLFSDAEMDALVGVFAP